MMATDHYVSNCERRGLLFFSVGKFSSKKFFTEKKRLRKNGKVMAAGSELVYLLEDSIELQ